MSRSSPSSSGRTPEAKEVKVHVYLRDGRAAIVRKMASALNRTLKDVVTNFAPEADPDEILAEVVEVLGLERAVELLAFIRYLCPSVYDYLLLSLEKGLYKGSTKVEDVGGGSSWELPTSGSTPESTPQRGGSRRSSGAEE